MRLSAKFGQSLSGKNVIVLLALLVLFLGPTALMIQPAQAAVTTNCTTVNGVPTANCANAGGNAATAIGNERKVFYYNGYWWIFWAQGSAIDYQFCQSSTPTGCATSSSWSTAATFTSVGAAASANGQGFSAWLDGAVLVYAVAPTSAATTTFYWGAVTLGAGSFAWLVQDYSMSVTGHAGATGVANPRISVSVDGNNYLWIAVGTLAGGNYYQDVYECNINIVTTPAGCKVATNWYTTYTFKMATTAVGYLTDPTLLPVTSGSSYMTLTYIDAATSGTGGPIDTYVSPSGSVSGSSILWQSSCGSGATAVAPTPCQTAQNSFSSGGADGIYYSAASSGATIYIVSSISGVATASLSYTEGAAGYVGYDAWDAASVIPTLSISGTNAVMTYPTGSSIQFYYCPLASITSGVNGWVGAFNLALNSEVSPNWAAASVASYTVGSYNLIGVIWDNQVANPAPTTQRVRFAVISMNNGGVVNFPVSLTFAMDEYMFPSSTHYALSATNYFTITYTVCTGCSGNGTYQYKSPSGAPLTINNVQSYSSFTITDQTSASTSAEKWCLLGGASCGVGVVSTYGASDTLDSAYYYYDQLVQPNLYAIATPSILSTWATPTASVATVNYDSATSTSTGFTLYPNPASVQPYTVPRADLYVTGGLEETTQWARTRDVLSGCTSQTIFPAGSGLTCAPSVAFGTLSAGPFNVAYPSVTVPSTGPSILEYVPIAITNSQSSSTPAGLQVEVVVDSATYAQYEASNLQNIEFFTSSGAILSSWLESGNSNTAASTTYWVNLGANNIVTGGTLTIYMGFASAASNFFSAGGSTGEAPTLSPTYALYDNGAVVFPSGYWNFAGTSLPSGWTTTFFSGATTAGTTQTILQDASASWVVNGWAGDYLQYTSGPASGLSLVIASNTATSITTAAFGAIPHNLGDNFVITTGNGYAINNGVSFTGATTSVLETTAAGYSDTGITEANFQVANQVNYGGVMLVTSNGGGQYNTGAWETVGAAVGNAYNGFDIDVWNANNNFRSFASGVATTIPAGVTPGTSSYIGGGTVNGGDTIEYVNELPSKAASYITTHVPASGNYYVAAGDTVGQIFSFNWLRIRSYPPSGVLPTVAIGPVTPVSGSPVTIKEYAPITLTNTQSTATPPYFQVDVNVTSNSPAFFSATTTSSSTSPSFTGVSTSSSSLVLSDAGATWTTNEWAGDYLTFNTGPAKGEIQLILSNTVNTITVGSAFAPAPSASGGDSFTVEGVTVTYDTGASWTANQWVNDYLSFTSGTASGQSLQIISNTANSITTLSFNPAPASSGGDSFNVNNGFYNYEGALLQNVEFFTCTGVCGSGSATALASWLESGNSNTAPNTVYWVRIPASIAASGGIQTIYIGFASITANLMSASGYVGEAPLLSTFYGQSDNGAQVFNFYDNFAGTTLSAQWAPTSTITSTTAITLALGQLGLATNYQNELISTTTPAELNNPASATFDKFGNLWVADSGDNRILEFTAPFTNGEAASLVIGQAGFGSSAAATTQSGLSDPRAVASDSLGNVWVADTGNNRVLEYQLSATGTATGGSVTTLVNTAASWTVNQWTGFTVTITSGTGSGETGVVASNTANTLTVGSWSGAGTGPASGSGYSIASPPNGINAALVIGQTLFTTNAGATSQTGESGPRGLVFDSSGNLWVADTGNNRVLEYQLSATGTATGGSVTTLVNTAASWTVNQWTGFTVTITSGTGSGETGVVASNTANTLTVGSWSGAGTGPASGSGYSIASPANDMDAALVIGQSLFTGNSAALTAAGENFPVGLAFDSSGNLWVADTGNNRVVQYLKNSAFITNEPATTILGQTLVTVASGTSTSATAVLLTDTSVAWTAGAFVGDYLEYTSGPAAYQALPISANTATTITTTAFSPAPTAAGGNTFLVLTTLSNAANQGGATPTASTLFNPMGVAVDSSGNVWVADTGNNRILEFVKGTGFTADQPAGLVLGQSSMTSNGVGTSSTTVDMPTGVLFDSALSTANLWVTDSAGNRVVKFAYGSGFSTGEAASAVVGQPNLSASANVLSLYDPTSAAFDSSGNLWVVDSGNNRILEYKNSGYQYFTGEPANVVIGQPSFTTNAAGTSATSLNDPTYITFDSSGNLWVADTGNNRILEFTAPFTNAVTVASGTSTSATAVLLTDTSVAWTAGAFVGDYLEYTSGPAAYQALPISANTATTITTVSGFNPAPTAAGGNTFLVLTPPEAASVVIGQSSMTTGVSATTQKGLSAPHEIAFDSTGNLWVADTSNSRVLEFAKPLTSNEGATLVLGQSSYTSGTPSVSISFSAKTTTATATVLTDSAATWAVNQWAGDYLAYTSGPANGQSLKILSNTLNTITTVSGFSPAPTAAGGDSFTVTGPTASSLSSPYGVAFDTSGNLWVADTGNNRVLEFMPGFSIGKAAFMVLGQNFFTSALAATSQTGLRYPTGIASDYWGDLWVADTGNNRVLEYQPTYNSLFTGIPAATYEGQTLYTTYGANQNLPMSGLTENSPMGIAFDSVGNLWVADTGNNRVSSQGTGTLTINNGAIVRQTSAWMGIISRATINPQSNILEVDGYFSSPNSQNQLVGLNTPTAATATPIPSNLYGIGTSSNFFTLHNGAGAASNIAADTIPASTPTLSYVEAESACTGGPIFYPATTVTCTAAPSMSTGTSLYWTLRNSSVSLTNSIPGQPNERWAASQNVLGWTLSSVFEVTPAIPYYHQYQDTFTFKSGGLVTSITPGITFTLYGTVFGTQNFPIATFTSANPSQSWYVDAGTTAIFPAQGVGAAAGTRWENSNNQSQTVVVNTPGSCTTLCTATYFEQYEQYLQYKTSDSSLLPTGQIPTMTYVTFARSYTVAIPTTASAIWVDALTTATSTGSVQSPGTLTTGSTSSGTSSTILLDSGASWTTNQFVGDYLTYTTGPAAGQSLLITANTAVTLTTKSAFSPAPTGTGGDSFMVVSLSQRWVTTTHMWVVTCSGTQSGCLFFAGTTTAGTTATTLQDASQNWLSGQWVGYYLTYISGPAKGLSEVITASSSTSVTTAGFGTSPTSSGGDSFEITGGIPSPMVFYHQFEQQIEPYKTSDYNAITSIYSPFISIIANATKTDLLLQSSLSSPLFVWADSGSYSNITLTLAGVAGERWSAPTTAWTITGSNLNGGVNGVIGPFGNDSLLYDHQFKITYNTIPVGPTLSIASCSYPLSTCSYAPQTSGLTVWQTTPMYVSSSGNSTFIPSGIGGTAGVCLKSPPYTGGCVSLTSSNIGLALLSAQGTVTAYYNLEEGVTFVQTGISEPPGDHTTWTIQISNSTEGGHYTAVGASSSSALAISLSCRSLPAGCTYTYTVSSPAYNALGNVRYFPTVTTGTFFLSPSISSTSVSLTFLPQYELTVISDPTSMGAFTGTYTNSSGLPSSGNIPGSVCSSTCYAIAIWLDPGSTASIGSRVANTLLYPPTAQPAWLGWTGTNCPAGDPPICDNQLSVSVASMTGPVALTANYQVALYMTLTPPSESAYIGETVTTNAGVFGGLGNVTIGAVVPPGLVGLVSISFYTLQNPSYQANPLVFAASAYANGNSPTGQVVIMEVQVSQHATLYGALNFTVTAQSSGYNQLLSNSGAQAICTTTGLPNCVYTLNIISPKPTVIGNAQTAFAVTTPGQSSLFYVNGHWLAFYYNGTSTAGYLVYASSQDANGSLWNTPQIVPSGNAIQGYSYAVTVSGNYVYYVLASNSTTTQRWSYFYWNYGTVGPSGSISWHYNAANMCLPNPPEPSIACRQVVLSGPGGNIAGQPAIAVGASGDIYVALPTLIQGSPTATPKWQVVLYESNPASLGSVTWNYDGQTTTRSISAVNVKLFPLTSGLGKGIALVDWYGNAASLPYVTVFSDGSVDIPPFIQECNPGPITQTLLPFSANLPNWPMYELYGAQSDVIANGNVLYFAGVNSTTNSVVKFYTYTYSGPGSLGGYCGSGTNGGWSNPQQVDVGAPTNKADNWHVSLAWSSGSIILGYGVDTQLGFAIGTQQGQSWSWFVLPSVQGVSGIQGGLTAAFASSGGGSGSVGMIWVEKISTNRYAIEFALA